ncbi:hypothetical protein U9M48_035563 [Paspalum notatum var. saurae]|uniref:SWIM-type domain-containing protein n=1 Tax=Paspalum notatum var. saurae TaxID=547442 RepID=A0AAQ3X8I6_PASNO
MACVARRGGSRRLAPSGQAPRAGARRPGDKAWRPKPRRQGPPPLYKPRAPFPLLPHGPVAISLFTQPVEGGGEQRIEGEERRRGEGGKGWTSEAMPKFGRESEMSTTKLQFEIYYGEDSVVQGPYKVVFWELILICNTSDWKMYISMALQRGWLLAMLVQSLPKAIVNSEAVENYGNTSGAMQEDAGFEHGEAIVDGHTDCGAPVVGHGGRGTEVDGEGDGSQLEVQLPQGQEYENDGKYKGTILTAIGVDGNNQVLPVAFAFVENENIDGWYWFLERVKAHVVSLRSNVCLISDRHAGILDAIEKLQYGSGASPPIWPNVHSRWCMRHLAANFHDHFKNKDLMDLFKRLCSQNQQRKFNAFWKLLDELTEKHQAADSSGSSSARTTKPFSQWIQDKLKEKWALLYDTNGRHYGIMTTNHAECYNMVMCGSRGLSLVGIVEFILYGCAKYFRERYMAISADLCNPSVLFGKRITKYMKTKTDKAETHNARLMGTREHRFEVSCRDRSRRGVHRERMVQESLIGNDGTILCSCMTPTLLHLPCSHVLAACREVSVDPTNFVSTFYMKRAIAATWNQEVFGYGCTMQAYLLSVDLLRVVLSVGMVAPGDIAYLLGLPVPRDAVGPHVVPSSWRDDLELRFAGVGHLDHPSPLDPHRASRGPTKNWLLQFQATNLHPNIDEDSVRRSLEAYLLWLFGFMMFKNGSSNSVDKVLIPYTQEIADAPDDAVPIWSRGSAVLAATYRGLCDACIKDKSNTRFLGCALLLQLWSYERLAVGRPIVDHRAYEAQYYGEHDDDRLTMGTLWVCPCERTWANEQARRTYPNFVVELDRLVANDVLWEPYSAAAVASRAPYGLSSWCTSNGALWYTAASLVHDIYIEPHCSNRVMRQFEYAQRFSVPRVIDRVSKQHHRLTRLGQPCSAVWVQNVHPYIEAWEPADEALVHPIRPHTDEWIQPISRHIDQALGFSDKGDEQQDVIGASQLGGAPLFVTQEATQTPVGQTRHIECIVD